MPFNKKLLYGLGAGLSLAASSMALYLLLKNDHEEQELEIGKPIVSNSKEMTLRIKVPEEYIGKVIGRGGNTIKQLQIDTKTRINVDQEIHEKDNYNDDWERRKEFYRTVIIRGEIENVQEAEAQIDKIINFQKSITTQEILVPEVTIGYIIGKKGSMIKEISIESGAEIRVTDSRSGDEYIVVKIKGAPDQIKKAKNKIDYIIGKHQPANHDAQHNRNDNLLSIDYRVDEIKINEYIAKLEPTDESGFIQVMVSAVINPSEFYVQLAGPLAARLDQLMDKTTDFYEIKENRENMKVKPEDVKAGDIVVAPYQHDEHWYRVKVVSIERDEYSPENSKVGIFYLDYGDYDVLSIGKICTLKPELLREMPFQAIRCSLADVGPINKAYWTVDAVEEFKLISHATQWKVILLKLINTFDYNQNDNEITKVNSVELSLNGSNLGDILVEKEFAMKLELK